MRGVLDNIVTDGMRVATEVRRRMDEAQKELEKNALPGQKPDDEEEDDDDVGVAIGVRKGPSNDIEGRSVRSLDRDLLDGVDAEAGASAKDGQSLMDADSGKGRARTGSTATTATTGVVEFEG